MPFSKVVLLGDHKTGKSSLLARYKGEAFNPRHEETYAFDFYKKNDIQFYDLAGKNDNDFVRLSDVLLLVFDLSNIDSFHHLQEWFGAYELDPGKKIILVGNKSDRLDNTPSPFQDEIDTWLAETSWEYHQVSAKNEVGIDQLFTSIEQHLLPQKNQPKFLEEVKNNLNSRQGHFADQEKYKLNFLDDYKRDRERRSTKQYIGFGFFGSTLSRLGGGYSKNEKFAAVDALKNAIETGDYFSLDPKHLKPLLQGQLGQLLKKHSIEVNAYIAHSKPMEL